MGVCGECIHYRWIEDLYDDGSYIESEYCDGDTNRDCSYHHNACEHFRSTINEGQEHMLCFGKYYDETGYPCENGSSGLCSYCMECQRADPNY